MFFIWKSHVQARHVYEWSCSLFSCLATDKPTPPLNPVDIIESNSTCIEFKWRPPKDDGGSPITDYILERQQIGRNSWKKLGKLGPEPKYRDVDVDHGRKYCYHVRAETDQGVSEMMETDDIQAGTKGKPSYKHTRFICDSAKVTFSKFESFFQRTLELPLNQKLLVRSKTASIWLGLHPVILEAPTFWDTMWRNARMAVICGAWSTQPTSPSKVKNF